MQINEQLKLPINGVLQYVSIRAEEAGLPLLLYLHGGPGDAALPLVLKYNRELESHFTVAVWEQRGAGKSYYDFGDSIITIDTFLQDLHSLIMLLTSRFHQKSFFCWAIPGEVCWGSPTPQTTRRCCTPISAAARS